jgi:GT2 family glycosyltransferase
VNGSDWGTAPCVLVAGMHRSGTSAVTRAVNLLGVPLTDPADLMPGNEGNAHGYWESIRLSDFDERLLNDVSSTWATPPYPFDRQRLVHDTEVVDAARRLLADVAGQPPWVWKDPRICLLLPFWKEVLDHRPVIVMVHRDPLEVAESISRRHALSVPHGLALWERYVRTAVRDCAGLPTFVLGYSDLLARPEQRLRELAMFLAGHRLPVDPEVELTPALASLRPESRHERANPDMPRDRVPTPQHELLARLDALSGPHDHLPLLDLGDETEWVDALLSSRRGLYIANQRLAEQRLSTQHEQNLRRAAEEQVEELAAAQDELARVRSECSTLQDDVARLQTAHDEVRAALDAAQDLAREAEERGDRAAMEVDAAVAAAEAAGRAVDVMRRSTSWRISAPVRALAPLKRAVDRRRGTGTLMRGTVDHLRREGVAETMRRARSELRSLPHQHHDYDEWVERFDTLAPAERARVEAAVASLDHAPLISVVMPVYNSDPKHLERAVESVRGQIYPYWQLCLADDASTSVETTAALERLARSDNRISLVRRELNGGIAAATNTALAQADGEFVCFVDHDDELVPTALYVVAQALERDPELDLLYSDEDKIDEQGQRYEPYFKPDYNPELLVAQNYFNHLTVVRRALVEKVGGLRLDLEGAQDHDLVLRLVEATAAGRIAHLPYVLYHWRQFGGATSFSREHAKRAAAAGTRAVQEHLDRTGQRAMALVDPRTPGWQRVQWAPPDPLPEVTVVIPTRDRLPLLRTCVGGLLERTDYGALRVLVADNDSDEPETLEYLDSLRGGERTDVVAVPGPFNYSAINNRAVEQVTSPFVLLLNNDIEVDGPNWLREMVGLATRDGVGAVGAKLYYGNSAVQHAGVVLGVGGVAGHAHKYRPAHETGYFGRLILTQEVAAVTGACLLTPTDLWRRLGGLDEKNLTVAFNDVDYCLRVREAGYRVVWAANAELRHLESISRGREESAQQVARFNREAAWMKRRWGKALQEDPTYSPNLTDVHEDFSLAHPPRVRKPWSD